MKNKSIDKAGCKRSILFIPYAEDPHMKSGVNFCGVVNRQEMYLKNCSVALLSAKLNNPNVDVALVTNIELPQKYKDLFERNNILVFVESFDEFVFPDDYRWGLAFYKLCALYKISRKYEYENFAYLDSDVYVQGDISPIWKECEHHIMMYDINHGLQTPDYLEIVSEFGSFLHGNKLITHYGGEFFAAKKEKAVSFSEECLKVFNQMIEKNFVTKKGDEFIISIVADKFKDELKNAGAYIYRYWTGAFFLVSTNFKFNPVPIMHLPSAKTTGIIKIYKRYIRYGKLPKKEWVWRICHLKKPSIKVRLKSKIKAILKKVIRGKTKRNKYV